MNTKEQIEKLKMLNPYVHKAFSLQKESGISYEETLEILVIALAEQGDSLRNVIEGNVSTFNSALSVVGKRPEIQLDT